MCVESEGRVCSNRPTRPASCSSSPNLVNELPQYISCALRALRSIENTSPNLWSGVLSEPLRCGARCLRSVVARCRREFRAPRARAVSVEVLPHGARLGSALAGARAPGASRTRAATVRRPWAPASRSVGSGGTEPTGAVCTESFSPTPARKGSRAEPGLPGCLPRRVPGPASCAWRSVVVRGRPGRPSPSRGATTSPRRTWWRASGSPARRHALASPESAELAGSGERNLSGAAPLQRLSSGEVCRSFDAPEMTSRR